ncbi:MAG: type I DNA topoisomerase, partial [Candidatus Omnitrophica bacterium]|nr:type I DNA topoisomerase [Candidatus Omnitrophota bacterium]
MKAKSLVIVESPTKAKTISSILGKDFSVFPCMGHLIDLPEDRLGISIKDEFKPYYIVIPQRKDTFKNLKKEVEDKKQIYIATDPDREGEAIGWHIKSHLSSDKEYYRVTFHEITPSVIKEAFKNKGDFNLQMVEAQIARRLLDRIVGYFLSPLLWRKVARGLSAGRVQSVALRLIVERERKIQGFKPEEYWQIEVELAKREGKKEKFFALLDKIGGEKVKIKDKKQVDDLLEEIKKLEEFKVFNIEELDKDKKPPLPFTTSSLQQEAFRNLKFSVSKTMLLAQQLYEGLEIGIKGRIGLITYMRTDSTRIAEEAKKQAQDYILRYWGQRYLAKESKEDKLPKHAQAAHEAIRPTSLEMTPESIKEFLTPDQYKLYELIYKRFLASQMAPMEYRVTKVYIQADKYQFLASGINIIFDGFTCLYTPEDEEKTKKSLPHLEKEELLDLIKVIPKQYFTSPPPRFSEGSLVKALEQEGIGRPSTYAPIIQTLIGRDYVRRNKGYLYPTELGFKVCDLLVEYFPKIMDVKFTAQMEEKLDEIEEGKSTRLDVLKDFYTSFRSDFDFAQKNIKKEVIVTEQLCEKCGKPMLIKWGKKGKFLSCSGYPTCKNSKPITTGIKCPQEGCSGEL